MSEQRNTINFQEKTYPEFARIAAETQIDDFNPISDLVCPFFEVEVLDGTYRKIKARDIYRPKDVKHGRGAPIKSSEFEWETATYSCSGRGQKAIIDRNLTASERAKPGGFENLVIDYVEMKAKDVKLAREIEVASLYFDESQYAAANVIDLKNDDGYYPLNDYANSPNFFMLMRQAIRAVRGRANAVIMGYRVYDAVCENPTVLASVLGGATVRDPADITEDLLARKIFGRADLGKVYVGESDYDASTTEEAGELTPIWGDCILVCHLNPAAMTNQLVPTFAKTFAFKQEGSVDYYSVRQWYDPDYGSAGSDVVAVSQDVDPKIIDPYKGFLFTNAYYSA